jgi:hypothetical protein
MSRDCFLAYRHGDVAALDYRSRLQVRQLVSARAGAIHS